MTNGKHQVYPWISELNGKEVVHEELGLTKREYFAAIAMGAFYKQPLYYETARPFEEVARDAVIMADALIEALNE